MKKIIIGIITVLSVMLLIISVFVFRYGVVETIVFFESLYVPNPPKPKIKYGEFPFTFIYEINGEEKIIEDALICEYEGVMVYGGIPNKKRVWKRSFKSGRKRLTLIQIDETNEIYYEPASSAMVQMGDGKSNDSAEYYSKNAYRYDAKEDPYYRRPGYDVNEEELLNKYGIKIISWYIAPPITNSFN